MGFIIRGHGQDRESGLHSETSGTNFCDGVGGKAYSKGFSEKEVKNQTLNFFHKPGLDFDKNQRTVIYQNMAPVSKHLRVATEIYWQPSQGIVAFTDAVPEGRKKAK